MSYLLYDNPETFRRENWEDGKIRRSVCGCAISQSGYFEKWPPFEPGKVWHGDLKAMEVKNEKEHNF